MCPTDPVAGGAEDPGHTPGPEVGALPRAPFPPYLLERYATWHHQRFAPNRLWHARLAEEGQRPRAMVISCCDSRMDTVQMFGAEPGDLFILRNVAGLVPPYHPDHAHHGTSAAVEYAVNVLRVVHVVVIGHSNCGGVAACDAICSGGAPETAGEGGFLGRWMEILRPGWERVQAAETDPGRRQRALEQEGVLTSLRNLAGFPFVRRAVEQDRLSLHGAWIDIGSGVLHLLDAESGHFMPLAQGGG